MAEPRGSKPGSTPHEPSATTSPASARKRRSADLGSTFVKSTRKEDVTGSGHRKSGTIEAMFTSPGTAASASPSGGERKTSERPKKLSKRETTDTMGRSSEEGQGEGGEGGFEHDEVKEAGEKGEKESGKKTSKRRKVNHACVYCRRSHMTCDQGRPCTRCIKRNIGHLCHDEPRETKKPKEDLDAVTATEQESSLVEFDLDGIEQEQMEQPLEADHTDLTQVEPVPASIGQVYDSMSNQQLYNEWTPNSQSQFQDIHSYNPNLVFSTSEVTNEYNLLNDFLSTSLLDEGAFYQGGSGDDTQMLTTDPSLMNYIMGPLSNPNVSLSWPNINNLSNQLASPPIPSLPFISTTTQIPNPPTTTTTNFAAKKPFDKAQEKYYMTAADPAGIDTPEARLTKLLKAKYEAGLLKPFNYVKGYARLNAYMERPTFPALTRQRLLRQIDRFRPKFRERMQKLTDIELVRVEMWFERKLMEYDRVFASMAVPACCWRRTGEIFRGNREMAELVGVELERLRDGKLAIHEILTEDSLVGYWEKFGAIAFEKSQKAMWTSCSLKCPGNSQEQQQHQQTPQQELRCCFSFTVQRDTHAIPSLIIGNFLPILPGS